MLFPHRIGPLAPLAAYGGHGEIFAAQKEAVEQIEDQHRGEGQDQIKREGEDVGADQHAEKAHGIPQRLGEADLGGGRKAGIVGVFNGFGHGVEKH